MNTYHADTCITRKYYIYFVCKLNCSATIKKMVLHMILIADLTTTVLNWFGATCLCQCICVKACSSASGVDWESCWGWISLNIVYFVFYYNKICTIQDHIEFVSRVTLRNVAFIFKFYQIKEDVQRTPANNEHKKNKQTKQMTKNESNNIHFMLLFSLIFSLESSCTCLFNIQQIT